MAFRLLTTSGRLLIILTLTLHKLLHVTPDYISHVPCHWLQTHLQPITHTINTRPVFGLFSCLALFGLCWPWPELLPVFRITPFWYIVRQRLTMPVYWTTLLSCPWYACLPVSDPCLFVTTLWNKALRMDLNASVTFSVTHTYIHTCIHTCIMVTLELNNISFIHFFVNKSFILMS